MSKPFVGIDGCHLKGPYGGVLLTTVSLDANNGLFPLPIVVVESELKESWLWFLELLHDIVGDTRNGIKYTLMSDGQKGLPHAVSQIFPIAYYRHCLKHLLNNFKAEYPHLLLRGHYWEALCSYSEMVFKKGMNGIAKIDEDAANWLTTVPINQWAIHAYAPIIKSPHITNNMFESFNKWINKFRGKTILQMLDGIRYTHQEKRNGRKVQFWYLVPWRPIPERNCSILPIDVVAP
ncbi:hypothetical protein L6164_026342 [Bauhinia variegata]|uniref:Uncharacterized protein n=1 Tax=Bauhinia variegata TaxID=167791 RepID=A0ACB9LQ54_BAUVA|nr:hypothetical protein L6164_026342 [Bauhinia variegata]